MNLLIASIIIIIALCFILYVYIKIIEPVISNLFYPKKLILKYLEENNYKFICKESYSNNYNGVKNKIDFNFLDKFIYFLYFYKVNILDETKKEKIIYVLFLKSGGIFIKNKIYFSNNLI